MRKLFIFIVLLLLVAPTAHAVESGFVPLVPLGIPGLTSESATSVVNSDTLANFFNNLYKYVIGLAAALAILQLIRGGLEIAFTGDNVSKLIESKGRVRQAILGLILVFLPVLVFSIINPSILNLSLNLPALDTKSSLPDDSSEGDAAKGLVQDGQICTDNYQCSSKLCVLSTGEKNDIGEPVSRCTHLVTGQCTDNAQCVSGYCNTGGGPTGSCQEKPEDVTKVFDGAPCQNDLQCTSKICDFAVSTKVCLVGTNLASEASCSVDRQCKSGSCETGFTGKYCE